MLADLVIMPNLAGISGRYVYLLFGADSLAEIASKLDPNQGLAIITEGLINYFDTPTVEAMWARFAGVLSGFKHGLYLSDLHVKANNSGVATRGFMGMLSTFVGGSVHLHFKDVAAAELALNDPLYEEFVTKFFEHTMWIAGAMDRVGEHQDEMWDEEDGFFYDVLHLPNGENQHLIIRSMVGLIPLFAVETIEPELLDKVPDFKRRLEWYLAYRPELANLVSHWNEPGYGQRRLLSLLRGHRMKRLLVRRQRTARAARVRAQAASLAKTELDRKSVV